MNEMKQIVGNKISNKGILVACIGVAVIFHLAVLFLFMDPHNLFWPDPQENYAIAKDLANGLPYSTPDEESNLGRGIGYPYFLSLLIGVIGPDLLGLRLVHGRSLKHSVCVRSLICRTTVHRL